MEKLQISALKREKKKSNQTVQSKKKKCEGPTCATFFSDLTRKFKMKKKSKEETSNITKPLKESTNALPVEVTIKTLETTNSLKEVKPIPINIAENINIKQPEPLDEVTIPPNTNLQVNETTPIVINSKMKNDSLEAETAAKNSERVDEILQIEPRNDSVNTLKECDIASELTKHVNTLRKISLITEEFNQKTAKNLREIVDSVSEDLVRKLEEVRAEQARSPAPEKKIAIN